MADGRLSGSRRIPRNPTMVCPICLTPSRDDLLTRSRRTLTFELSSSRPQLHLDRECRNIDFSALRETEAFHRHDQRAHVDWLLDNRDAQVCRLDGYGLVGAVDERDRGNPCDRVRLLSHPLEQRQTVRTAHL